MNCRSSINVYEVVNKFGSFEFKKAEIRKPRSFSYGRDL